MEVSKIAGLVVCGVFFFAFLYSLSFLFKESHRRRGLSWGVVGITLFSTCFYLIVTEPETPTSLEAGDYRVLYTNVSEFPPVMKESEGKNAQLFAIVRGYDESPGRSTKVAIQKRLPRCFHVGKDHEILGLKCPDESQIAESE